MLQLISHTAMSASYWGTKIVAVAKNYGAHAVEMGGKAEKQAAPSIFLKPNSSVIGPGSAIVKPRGVRELHFEVELGVVIGRRTRSMRAADWRDAVGGYVLGLDMTARDLQGKAKVAGQPWTQSKCYDTFTPLSGIIPATAVPDPAALELYLRVDGAERQRGRTRDMLHSVPELLEFISGIMTLEPGDVILTGTPEGVGAVEPGQRITAGLVGLVEETWPVEAAAA